MAKGPAMPSKAQMARQERKYQAERMVQEGMKNTPAYKQAMKTAMHHLEEGEKAARMAMKGNLKPTSKTKHFASLKAKGKR